MIQHEASFLSKLCHLGIPLFFGKNTLRRPYYIVVQFYGLNGKSITIQKELNNNTNIHIMKDWIVLCAQLVDTIRYLHEDTKCIHNDIKGDNVLLTNSSMSNQIANCSTTCGCKVVLIDFNKAT